MLGLVPDPDRTCGQLFDSMSTLLRAEGVTPPAACEAR
jgi:hypothetical protein